MQKRILISVLCVASLLVLAAVVVFSWTQVTQAQARGQGQNQPQATRGNRGDGGVGGGAETNAPSVPAPPGWKPCPRCQNNTDRRRDNITYKVDGHPFDPHDFSGVWGFNDTGKLGTPPPLTAWGKEQHEKTIGEKNQYGEYLHSKDFSGRGGGAKINCDPTGWPRLHVYNYGVEFMMGKDKIVQLFQLPQTFRIIWMDGRKLPAEPPEDRWNGWSVGHWEGDTLVVESNGFDERSWIDSSQPDGGWTHSNEMTVTERWRRTSYGVLESQITIRDPKTYTADWVGPKATTVLVPGAELWENYCAPSDHNEFNEDIYGPPAKGGK